MKSKSFEVAQVLFTKAGHDLQAAELLMADGATDVVCFHLQQSVKKLLKAYLQVCEVAFPHTHDLDSLLDICLAQSNAFEIFRDRLEAFIPYAVLIRYEMDFEPTREEAKAGLVLALEVRDACLKLIPDIYDSVID